MSIKSLVTEHIRIEEAEDKLRQRKSKLQQRLNTASRGIEIIDGVVWKIEYGYGSSNNLTRVGEVNA